MRDTLIVLGAGVTSEGTLNDFGKLRVKQAAAVHTRYKHIIMSGYYTGKLIPPTSEAKAMSNYAASLGVPNEKIILEEHSKDTFSNIYYSKKLLSKKASVGIVTSETNLERTTFICNHLLSGHNITYHPVKIQLDPNNKQKYLQRNARKLLLTKCALTILPLELFIWLHSRFILKFL